MTINLEVGKAYRNRSGEIVVIVAENPGEIMQFVSSGDETYKSDGRYNITDHSTPWDLVEEFKHFHTQQEIFKYLASGGCVKELLGGNFLVGFNAEGILCRYDPYGMKIMEDSWYFDKPMDWTIAVPKVKSNWYDNIPEQGILCWVDDYYKDRQLITGLQVVIAYEPTNAKPFVTYKSEAAGTVGYPFASRKYAIPVTLDEITKYILESKNEIN